MAEKDLIILTGGAGFIGSCFLWKLNQMGEKNVLVVDHDDSPEKMANLAGKAYKDFQEKADFIKRVEANKLPSGIKAVWHIGACSSTTETDAEYLDENNTNYSKSLCRWSLDHAVPFFYASSAATYGSGDQGYSDQDSLLPRLKPLNLYGLSKQKFDLWLLKKGLTKKVVGFKYFNVYGPNEYHKGEMRSLVVKAYQQIKQDGRIRLFKSYKPEYSHGEQKRDFIYVKDCLEVMYKFWEKPKIKGIFNLGTGLARSWNDLARAIFHALGLPARIEYIDMPPEIKDKYQYFTQAELMKFWATGIKHEFMPLEAAVEDYVRNYLEKGLVRL